MWHNALFFKLDKFKIPTNLIKLIQNYLSDRTFQIVINETKSSTRNIIAGVPQESVLGPTLYNLYTSDIHEFKKANIALYADDTVLYTTSHNQNFATLNLQRSINILTSWLQTWKIKINPIKSNPICFNNKIRNPNVNIQILNKEI